MRIPVRRLLAAAAAIGLAVLIGAPPASAHPLGNFSVNHLDALTFEPHQITDHAIVDFAEIPTAQAGPTIDTDGDGRSSDAELAAYGAQQCVTLLADQRLAVGGRDVAMTVVESAYAHRPGAAGLPTGRLECTLRAAVDLSNAASVSFADGFDPDRVGWHEITAIGSGVTLVDSPVATSSVTDGLQTYPVDLLSSPMAVREASFSITPGGSTGVTGTPTAASTNARHTPTAADRFASSGLLNSWNSRFNDLVGRSDLTLGVGLLAVGLALVLGASHALLPGHGKTVMAAYIAGRQGSIGDAVIVGATVTGTHTGGVLLLGLALTTSTTLAGEVVIAWLGVAGGLLVVVVGLGILAGLFRHRHEPASGRPHRHGFGSHSHRHAAVDAASHSHDDHAHHDHAHHDHDHHDHHDHARHDHDHVRHDDVDALLDGYGRGHDLEVLQLQSASRPALAVALPGGARSIDPGSVLVREMDDPSFGHSTSPTIGDRTFTVTHDESPVRRVSRRGLMGMGIAGGLVPSPSALVILLSAIALGRTWFGVLLVVTYGLGMAATLTAAGVLLVTVRDRYQHRITETPGRLRRLGRHWSVISPYATATFIIIVGAALAVRGLAEV